MAVGGTAFANAVVAKITPASKNEIRPIPARCILFSGQLD
jgi:hypothetical protein